MLCRVSPYFFVRIRPLLELHFTPASRPDSPEIQESRRESKFASWSRKIKDSKSQDNKQHPFPDQQILHAQNPGKIQSLSMLVLVLVLGAGAGLIDCNSINSDTITQLHSYTVTKSDSKTVRQYIK